MSDTKFSADYSKRASKCKKCKQELPKGSARLAKLAANFFHDGEGEMKSYFHINCLFDSFKRAKATTKVIESTDDVEGFIDLNDDDKNSIIDLIKGNSKLF
jgi:DNA ligase-3